MPNRRSARSRPRLPARVIEAHQFVEAARIRGFRWYAGVPCSFLTPFINFVLRDSSLRYVSMGNEGDAVALIAGVALAGDGEGGHGRGITMMQNSGLGNAVSPLTSLTWTFHLPQLLIVTWRGQPGIADEPQHALMGPITPALLEAMQIPWELFPTDADAVGAALDRAAAHMDASGRPYCLLMQKGSVAPYGLDVSQGRDASKGREAAAGPDVSKGLEALKGEAAANARELATRREVPTGVGGDQATRVSPPHAPAQSGRVSRQEALREVVARTAPGSTAILASTGYCGRELYAIADRPNQIYMVGSMGCVTPWALGLALARPDLDVLAVDGDGAALMRMGAMATVGAYSPPNLKHLLLDNGAHDSTGGQATVSSDISFGGVAAACGYSRAMETEDLGELAAWLEEPRRSGPSFARLWIRTGTPADLPRPAVSPADVKRRFMQHFAAGAR
jgi:phosphonopyruvate decarboxylase